MAKAVLRSGAADCDDLSDTEDPKCIMQAMLYGIVNGQNYEIGVMSNVLAAMNLPRADDCVVEVPIHRELNARNLRKTAATAAGAIFGAAAQLF